MLLAETAFISPLVIDEAVTRALSEDLGRAGDITSIATIPSDAQGEANLIARKAGVVAGLPLVEAVFERLSPSFMLKANFKDGAMVESGACLMTIVGPARALLAGERTALNFLGHMSGVATATAELVALISHTKARVTCTRKTVPGLRALQKYAVRCGGGFNHRFGLDDAILIKDNHIAVAGGIQAVLQSARRSVGQLVKIEIEVDTLDQLQEALDVGGADVVLLDNMDVAMMRRAVDIVRGRVLLEASGGITRQSISAIAETGVDYISSGAITHSAMNLDVALDVVL